MNYIPRCIHSASIIMREAINECIEYCADVSVSTPWGAWWYEYRILATYRDKFECRECDCCGESWSDCRCRCEYADDYDENEHLIRDENE